VLFSFIIYTSVKSLLFLGGSLLSLGISQVVSLAFFTLLEDLLLFGGHGA